MIKKINYIANVFSRITPITSVYGLARTVLAFGTFLTFLFNSSTDTLFFNLSSSTPTVTTVRSLGLFFLLGENHLILSKLLSLIVLFLVMIGWRPRITGILHWYVCYSFFSSSAVIDGGDQIVSIITLFLIPICLIDNRKWHWHSLDSEASKNSAQYINLFAWSVFLIIKIQVAIIYFHSAIAKLQVPEWIDGTDTYYWFTNPVHGSASWIKPAILFLMSNPLVVVVVTWGTIIMELFLSFTLFMRKNHIWKTSLILGICLHLGIILIHGLISFFFSMCGSLILFLYPLNLSFKIKALPSLFKNSHKNIVLGSDLS